MRLSIALILLLPGSAFAQPTAEQKKATIKWVTDLQAPGGGFYLAPQDPKIDTKPVPSLRATNAALRTLKYLGAEIPNKDRHAAFILMCFDPKTGGFADAPDGKADVATTSIGMMAAAELNVPHEKYAFATLYLKENAKTFEDVRIGAAAIEAWGVKDSTFKLDEWFEIAAKEAKRSIGDVKEGGARISGSYAAMVLRLGGKIPEGNMAVIGGIILGGQRDDGAWSKAGEKASDIESTYRVMRALMLLKEKPKDVKKLREFIESHHNKDGGYATKPGDKSNMSGTYYATIITHWLDEMEKK
jgi:prenyltransferase beta subunit